MAAKKKFYVVWKGVKPGIYDSWDSCREQIMGFTGAVYKSFESLAVAEQAYAQSPWQYVGQNARGSQGAASAPAHIGRPLLNSIAVDAACSGNPGVLEYQGVDTRTGERIFQQGPFPLGTVNLGEFLAIVHGLGYLKKHNLDIPVYTDSRTAMKWVRDKKINSKLERNKDTEQLFLLIDRALLWLRSNKWENRIIKWETRHWGEIPADFGRK